MKNKTLLLVSAVLLVFTLAACGKAGLPGADEDAGILFSDDFSSSSTGWDKATSEEGSTDYAGGEYQILVKQTNYDMWANPYLSFTDVSVEVDAAKAAGPEDNDFGIICRYVDESNFYFAVVASDGFYCMGKVKDGSQTFFNEEGMPSTNQVNGGDASNHLRFDCVGSKLTFYVNGQILDQYEDSDFSTGDVGLMAGTFDEGGVDIRFKNFVVSQP